MGTLLTLDDPVAGLVAALRTRHGVEVTTSEAAAALAAEIAYYRAHHDEGHDAGSLRALRLTCAAVLGEALPASARSLDTTALLDVLLIALRFRAYEDAGPALAALRDAGLAVAVVSNWDASLPQVLDDLGLRVDAVITSAQVGAAKPAPAIFAAALQRLGVAAADAVHVGDSVEYDVVGARASGIAAILLCREGEPAPSPGVPVIATLSELVAIR